MYNDVGLPEVLVMIIVLLIFLIIGFGLEDNRKEDCIRAGGVGLTGYHNSLCVDAEGKIIINY